MNVEEPVAVVSHDAGGAEILSSYLRREPRPHLLAIEGPARKVFERKFGSIRTIAPELAIQSASWVLCGTSWQSDLEWRSLRLARVMGKRSVTFLDHWVNYRQRFKRGGEQHLPDEIWVADEYAARLASDCFAGLPIRLMGNPYFEDLRAELKTMRGPDPARRAGPVVLYICEPVRAHALFQHGNERYWGYVEEEVLAYLLQNLQAIASDIARIVVRPHPSEPGGKYSWVPEQSEVPVEISDQTTLIQDIAAADIVVGIESMAMVVGLLAGKRVLTAIPPGGRSCVLPHDGIESLRNLVGGGEI